MCTYLPTPSSVIRYITAFSIACYGAGFVSSQPALGQDRSPVAWDDSEDGGTAGGGLVAFISGTTLHVQGSAVADSIRLVINAGDPSQLDIYSPYNAGSASLFFSFNNFDQIEIALDDGDDLLILDEANGPIVALATVTIDGGDGFDTILTATQGLPVPTILSMLNTLDTARSLLTQANDILDVVGASGTPGTTPGMIRDAVLAAQSAHSNLIDPAAVFVRDMLDDIIIPASDEVLNAYNGVFTDSLRLVERAYNDVVLPARALVDDIEQNLIPQAQALEAAANQLRQNADSLVVCGSNLAVSDAQGNVTGAAMDFIARMEELRGQIEALLEQCPEDAPDPAEPPEGPETCPQAQELADCIELEADLFQALVEICESDGDALSDEADALALQGDALETLAEQYEASAEALEALADAYVLLVEQFEQNQEAWAQGLDTLMDSLTSAIASRAATEIENAAAALQAMLDSTLRVAADDVAARAATLASDAQILITQAAVLLEGTLLSGGGSCASISTNSTVYGGPGPDIIYSSGPWEIHGDGGPDLLVGSANDEKFYGGDGSDLIYGGDGTNEIHGDDGIDILIGGNGTDCIYGGDGKDLILGRGGNDTIEGNEDIDIILCGAGNDQAHGNEEIDVILGQDGNDKLFGDDGIDLILGGNGADEITGGGGQTITIGSFSIDLGDVLLGNSGADDIHGDAADDTGDGVDFIFGGNDPDTIHAAHGGDVTIGSFTFKLGNFVMGGSGDDTITCNDGVDVVFGGNDHDTITVGIGSTLQFSGFELQLGDLVFGGPGRDTIHGDDPNAVDDPQDPNDYQTDVDILFGQDGPDTIYCYAGGKLKIGSNFEMILGNVAFGGNGNDLIYAEKGVDFLFGGDGSDTIEAQDGAQIDFGNNFEIHMGDFLIGGAGNDTLHGDRPTEPSSNATDDGFDVILGNSGDDRIYGGRGGEMKFSSSVQFKMGTLAIGGPDDDTIYGDYQNLNTSSRKDGIDIVIAGAGNDFVDIGPGDDLQIGSGSNQIVIDFGGVVIGHTGADTIHGGKDLDVIIAGAQNDTVYGYNGIDFVLGGNDADTIYVHDGGYIVIPISGTPTPIPFGNIVLGGDHNDFIDSDGLGLIEIDLLLGNRCDDTIYSGDGLLDIVIGGQGRDELHGENGQVDLLIGGRGRDTIYCEPAVLPSLNIAIGGKEDDYIVGSSDLLSIDFLLGGQDRDEIHTGDGLLNIALGGRDPDRIWGGSGLLDILMGGLAGDELHGAGGPLDILLGGLHDDCIYAEGGILNIALGGFGDDILVGGGGLDILAGGFGADSLVAGSIVNILLGGFGPDHLEGGTGLDILLGGFDSDCIFGRSGVDIIMGGFGDDKIAGNDQLDVILGGFGSDVIDGGDAVDILLGGFQDDTLIGGSSIDIIVGSFGNDNIDGQDGSDILIGGFDGDHIVGLGGNDLMVGGFGSDTLYSGSDGARDLMLGGPGNDTFFGYAPVSNCSCCNPRDIMHGGLGNDTKNKGSCHSISFTGPSCAEISGTVYVDYEGDAIENAPLGGVIVYLDLNNDGVRQGNEPAVTTPGVDNPNTCINEIGYFRFTGLSAGTYRIRQQLNNSFQQLVPGANGPIVVSLGGTQHSAGHKFVDYAYCYALPDGSCGPCQCPNPLDECVPYRWDTFYECADGKPCDANDDCPCGFDCQPVQRVVEYRCQPIAQNCRLVDGPNGLECVGTCPPGMHCTLFYDASQNPFCECVPQPPSCQLVDDPQGPGGFGCIGICNDGTPCILVPSPVAPGWECVCNSPLWSPDDLPSMTCDVRTFGKQPIGPTDPFGDADATPVMPPRYPRGSAPQPSAPLVPPPPHDARKNRYISFVPNNGGLPVAFEIVIPPCRRGWVGPPRPVMFNGRDAGFVCDVVPVPVYRVWNEPVLHVRGCVIAPERSYDLIAHHSAGGFSSPLTLHTVSRWGDVVGVPLGGGQWSPPDGVLNAFDRAAVAQKASGTQFPHTTWADLGPQTPDYFVDQTDIDAVDDAVVNLNPYPPSTFPALYLSSCDLGFGCGQPCGDLNGDGMVNAADFAIFVTAFGLTSLDAGYVPCADFDFNGVIDQVDFAAFTRCLNSTGPANDNCVNATIIGDGVTAFSNIGASTDGLPHPQCLGGLSTQIYNDLWYRYTAPRACTLTIESCGGTTVDTKIAVYVDSGVCPPTGDLLIGCNDDACGLQSRVRFQTAAGVTYLIRLGSSLDGGVGSGTFRVECDACFGAIRADSNCDGVVNNFDIDCFVDAVVGAGDPTGWIARGCQQNACDYLCVNDTNRDGTVNNFDIDSFVDCIVQAGCP